MRTEGMWGGKDGQMEKMWSEGDSPSSPLPGDGVSLSLSWPGPHYLPETPLNL